MSIPIQVQLSKPQREKILKKQECGKTTNVLLKIGRVGVGTDQLFLTQRQIGKMEKNREKGKGTLVKFSLSQMPLQLPNLSQIQKAKEISPPQIQKAKEISPPQWEQTMVENAPIFEMADSFLPFPNLKMKRYQRVKMIKPPPPTKMKNPPPTKMKNLQKNKRERKPSISLSDESDDEIYDGMTKEESAKFSKFVDDFSTRAKMNLVDRKNPQAVEKKAKELADFFVEKWKKNEVGKSFGLRELNDFFSVFINPKKLKEEMKEKYLMKIFHTQTGGSLFSLIPTLAKAALPTAAKALGLAGLSFGVEKALKKIFGSDGIPPEAVELAKLVEKLSPAQKKSIKNVLVGQGFVGSGQRGGFLGLLASLGIPLAISLVKKVMGKGMRIQPSGRGMRLQPRGKGMRLQPPPPFVGSWKKKIRGCTLE